MAIITLDDVGITRLGGQSYGQQGYDLVDESPITGAAFVMPMGPPRWVSSIRSPQAMALDEAGAWESLVLRLRRGINHLALFDMLRPAPLGSLRGAPTLKNSVAVGASTIVLANARTAKNLLTYGTAFEAAPWASTATVTPNTTARPGTSSVQADTVADTSTSASQDLAQVITVPDDALARTFSIYVRRTTGGTAPTLRLQLAYSGGTTFSASLYVDTDAGTILAGSGTVVASGSDWWRCSLTVANNATGNTTLTARIFPAAAPAGSGTPTITATGSAILWGAQLEEGSAVTSLEVAPTLQVGDWLQVGTGLGTSQLVKVVETATASTTNGDIQVRVEPELRYAFTAGTAVAWDRPVAYYKLRNQAATWQAVPNGPAIDGFALDLLEQWA